MAIQVRRGDYADFDASKLVAGEPAMVLTNDPDTSDGTAVYFGAGDGTARRLMYANEVSPLTDAEIDAITQ